jgi:putative addiction module CopG family antidote
MKISLTPRMDQWVSEKVGSGLYSSSNEVILEGLRLLMCQEEQRQAMIEDLRSWSVSGNWIRVRLLSLTHHWSRMSKKRVEIGLVYEKAQANNRLAGDRRLDGHMALYCIGLHSKCRPIHGFSL